MFKVMGLSRKQIRNKVNKLTVRLNLDRGKPVDIIKILEHALPHVYKNYNYEIVDVDEMGETLGKYLPDKNLIMIRQDVYEGAIDGDGRHRFTIAHEIGHFMLHNNINSALQRTNDSYEKEEIKPYENPEWQADCFAAELLMPYHIILSMSEKEIESKYKVSHIAARTQKSHI